MARMSFTQEVKELARASEGMDAGGCSTAPGTGTDRERARPRGLDDAVRRARPMASRASEMGGHLAR
jgi:hypothetical protein